ncbi:unnamed protein product [Mytilus coruscus]|uniref:G-protein coupled receptors family 2 profile 2 domain-containing protein n=1 Tax=Mytilus coruscus TaxID=42192 RepID=A0A6J8EJX7_MYTCO|nr:unnamed protein product [Mytilus coruscus]
MTPECIPFRKADFRMIRGNFVINSCADYWGNSRTAIKCRTTDILTVGPWVVETDTNLVFQNGYCAQCNNISEYKQFAVKISNMPIDIFLNITASAMYDALTTYRDNDLIMEFVPPEAVNVRSCLILIQPTIEKEDCMNYYVNPVIKLGGMVRNKFCIHQDEFVACAGMFVLPDDIKIDHYGLNPLSGIFHFNESCKTEMNVNGICMDEALYENFFFTTYLYLIPSTNLSENSIEEIGFIVVWSFGTPLNTWSIMFNYFDKVGNYSFAPFVCYVQLSFSFVNKLTAKEIMVFKSKVNDMERLILLKSQHGLVYEVYTVRTNERRDVGYQQKSLDQPQIKRKIDNLIVDMTGNHEVEFCGKSIIKCEISKDAEEKKIIIKEVTCNDVDSIQQSLLSTAMITEDVVKYTVIGISIIVLTASVIFNRRFGTLRSISGSNLENLLNTLIISDMIFLIGIAAAEHFTVCYIVGVFMHFLWLLVFSFQSIALYLIIKTNTSDNSANESGSKRYKKIPLTLVGLFLPFVFVAPAVILDLMKIPDFSLNYSGFICFPTGYPANLIFVYMPIGLSVVNNISLLAFIAFALKKNTLGKSSFLQYVPVFVHITVVTCIPWVIGFLGVVFQTELMDFLFVICYGIQGLLIAIANLTARCAYYSFCKQSPRET